MITSEIKDYREAFPSKLLQAVANAGYVPGDYSGDALSRWDLDKKKENHSHFFAIGILTKEPIITYPSKFFGLVRPKPRRRHIATIRIDGGNATNLQWVADVWGRDDLEATVSLLTSLAASLQADVAINLVSNEIRAERFTSDTFD